MKKVTITINQNEKLEVPIGTTYLEISELTEFKDDCLGVTKNNEILNLSDKVTEDEAIEFFNAKSLEGAKIYKAAVKFIFEVALKTLIKGADIHYLHSVPGGMLGEIKCEEELTHEDISKIKQEMANIIDENLIFKRYNILKTEATKFYENAGLTEKAKNMQTSENIVTIYKLRDTLNYFYVPMPYSTKYVKQFSLNYLGHNRIVILYPNNLSDGKLPEYVHHENIIKSFYEGHKWLAKLKTPYLSNLNKLISDGEIKGFIESCELNFTDQIKKASEEIIKNFDKKFIMIAGPSSSGKTTSTRVLGAYLRSKGYDPICLSTDDYFVNREETPKDDKGNYDFECLNAIDIKLLNKDITDLLDGKEISVPTFNFVAGKKEYHNHFVKLKENSIILMEGLHCLNDDLTPYVDNKYKYKIYLSPFIPLNIDRHNYISTLDLRLIRRIVRDNRTRGHSPQDTIKNWQSVRNGEEKYIFPYIHQADIIVNTALPYEIGVLKVYIEPHLYAITTDSPYYEEARRLIKFLHDFYAIPSELVSNDSILREFIGGKNND